MFESITHSLDVFQIRLLLSRYKVSIIAMLFYVGATCGAKE